MARIPKIYIINGPNLNLLGVRNPGIYGKETLDEIIYKLRRKFRDVMIRHYQSNHEGHIIDKLHKVGFDHDGIIINPGAYTHTSIAIRDAIEAIPAPVIEVHISNIYEREEFRKISLIKDVCVEQIYGQGSEGYHLAIKKLLEILKR